MAHVRAAKTKQGVRRYVAVYRPTGGRQREKWFTTRKAAERFCSTIEVELSRDGWSDPRQESMLFETLAAEWLASNPAKRSSSWARDESVLRVHLLPHLARRKIGSVRSADIRKRVAEWTNTKAPRTVKRNYGVLRAIFAFAVESEYIGASPCRGIKLPTAEPVECHVVDAKELARLAEALQHNGLIVYLGAVLGMRWGECAGLRVGRIDFEERTIMIAEQVVRGRGGVHTFGAPKSNAGRRTLAVPVFLMKLLEQHMASDGLKLSDTTELVFPAPQGGPMRYEHWRSRVWMPAVETAGLSGLCFHDLRRANATAMVRDGVDLKTAQTRLGHSDPRLTLAVYAQATTEADRVAAERLGVRFALP